MHLVIPAQLLRLPFWRSYIFDSLYCLQVYPDGKMSQHLASLKPGDVVEVKG